MTQQEPPNPHTARLNLDKRTKELTNAAAVFEEATKLRQALSRVGTQSTKALKTTQKEAVGAAKERLEKAVKNFAGAQEEVISAYANHPEMEANDETLRKIRSEATETLAKIPPPSFDKAKMLWVLCILAPFAFILGWLIDPVQEAKNTVVIGLVISAVGQIGESVGKAGDAQNYPRLIDGLSLCGEALKIFGVLAALVGVAFGIMP